MNGLRRYVGAVEGESVHDGSRQGGAVRALSPNT